jgi:hypothetical protein
MSSNEASENLLKQLNANLTPENRARRRVLLRPNGKIRSIPRKTQKRTNSGESYLENTAAEISFENIQQGNVMANFHNSYDHGRYYHAKNIPDILSRYGYDPHTRRPLTRNQITTYSASINGDMTGVQVPPDYNTLYPSPSRSSVIPTSLPPLLPRPVGIPPQLPRPVGIPPLSSTRVLPSLPPPAARPVSISFLMLTGTRFNNVPFQSNDPMYRVVERFQELRGVNPIRGFIEFIGIPLRRSGNDEENPFLVQKFLAFMSGYRNVSKNLSEPIYYFNQHYDPTMMLHVRSNMSRFGILDVMFYPPVSFDVLYPRNNVPASNTSNSLNRLTLESQWIDIRNEATEYAITRFATWLEEHPNDYALYKTQQFTPALLTFTESLKKEVIERIEKNAQDYVDSYLKLQANRSQPLRRNRPQNRRTRRARKNRRSQ